MTVKSKCSESFSAGVIVSPLNCAGVSVQKPPPLSIPADKVGPVGTPVTTMLKLSELSVNAELILSVMAESSFPSS